MNAPATPICWICNSRPADSAEHLFKASDVRAKLPDLTQQAPAFLHVEGQFRNMPIGSAKSGKLTFKQRICAQCNNSLTQPYDRAWEKLSDYLHSNWPRIARLGRFDLSRPFPGQTRRQSLLVHLYFVKAFGCKIREESIAIDLSPFASALQNCHAHPEVHLLVCNDSIGGGRNLMYNSEVHAFARPNDQRIDGALWMYMVHPVAVKVAYIQAGAPLRTPGNLWHPSKGGKVVKLSVLAGASGRNPKKGPDP
jgi:hypothetical protein